MIRTRQKRHQRVRRKLCSPHLMRARAHTRTQPSLHINTVLTPPPRQTHGGVQVNTTRILPDSHRISELRSYGVPVVDLVGVCSVDTALSSLTLLVLEVVAEAVAGWGGDNAHCMASPTEHHSLGISSIITAIIYLRNVLQTRLQNSHKREKLVTQPRLCPNN